MTSGSKNIKLAETKYTKDESEWVLYSKREVVNNLTTAVNSNKCSPQWRRSKTSELSIQGYT
ncbi:MAG TPA: hypothetical protein VI278_07635, partial [Nitrososphaeraceae archaeon]